MARSRPYGCQRHPASCTVPISSKAGLAHALDVQGDGGVVDDDLRLAHELLARLDVAGVAGERVHLADGRVHPQNGHPTGPVRPLRDTAAIAARVRAQLSLD